MKDTEQIREAAQKYADYDSSSNNFDQCISDAKYNGFFKGYRQALSDMKEGVDVIELREKWLSDDVSKMGSNNIFNWFIPYIHQPAQESDGQSLNKTLIEAKKSGRLDML